MSKTFKSKKLTIDDDHENCIRVLLDHIPKDILSDKPLVLHVGAHKGEEVPVYIEYGFEKIQLIEANPELSYYLIKKFESFKNITVDNYAISNRRGKIEFIIHRTKKGSVESSSILKLKKLGEFVPTFDSNNTITVDSETLDNFYKKNFITKQKVNLLVLDIQGAEFMVLQSAKKMLETTEAIICEVNLIETYENCHLEDEISDFLESQGFYNHITIYHELYNKETRFPAWGEGLWLRKKNF